MGKKENHKKDFDFLIKSYIENQDGNPITQYIIKNSNLPGKRGNLEMAEAFYESLLDLPIEKTNLIWSFLIGLTNISEKEAPKNTPEELLPFCGILGLTSLVICNKELLNEVLNTIRKASNDTRWRMREAVGMSLTKLINKYSEIIFPELESWIIKNNWLEFRAVAAGLAEPHILRDKTHSEKALNILKKIFYEFINSKITVKSSESFKILKKGLGYCLSVIVQFNPVEGFKFMNKLATYDDKDIRWILKENLKKARLTKNYPKEVAAINQYLK